MKSSPDRARSGVFLKGGVTMRVWAKLIKTDITTFSSIGTVPCSSASILLIPTFLHRIIMSERHRKVEW